MFRLLIAIVIIGLFQEFRVYCFKFPITKEISQTNPLNEADWCFVEITENENVIVKVDIPLDTSYSGVFIYFANEQKEILRVNLKECHLNKTVGQFGVPWGAMGTVDLVFLEERQNTVKLYTTSRRGKPKCGQIIQRKKYICSTRQCKDRHWTIEGTFYEIPYKPVKEMKGEKTETVENDKFHEVRGEFPKFWLPNNCSKVSAAVECVDGRILNYFKIQNYKISFPDLMILEEFNNYKSN